jgi:phosphoribosylglycinamide formyltransferase-1
LNKIAVLVSGNGSNLQALIDNFATNDTNNTNNVVISCVISDKPDVFALERAEQAGIPTEIVPKSAEQSDVILDICKKYNVQFIVCAGFLSILKGRLLSEYENRIINLHPALLPKYGGKGMYGEHVHQAVLAAGETESGCTVHYVTDKIDGGKIILQRKVPVLPDDTVDTLAERIHKEEHRAIVEAVKEITTNNINNHECNIINLSLSSWV